MPQDGTVLLVESDEGERERLGTALGTEDAPSRAEEIGVGTTSDDLVALYAGSGRTVVAIDAVHLDPIAQGNIIRLDRHPEVRSVVAAVRIAAEVEGFVLRRPLGDDERLLD